MGFCQSFQRSLGVDFSAIESLNEWMETAMPAGDKIIVIAENLAEPWDEGFKKFAHSLAEVLAKQNDMLILNVDRSGVADETALRVPGTRTFFSEVLRQKIRTFAPDKIIYIPSASTTSASFLRAKALRFHAPRAKIGVVGLQPRRRNGLSWTLIKWLAPHVVFVFSYSTLLSLQRRSIRSALLPMGIDLTAFRPAHPGEKESLRKRHAIPADAFVAMHAGHLSPSRNLLPLTLLCAMPGSLVLLVSSTSTREDAPLREHLESKGVRVIRKIVPIEEFYRLSDCYVFPVEDPYSCAEIPLGVLEALASGIPVISRPFGGLRDLLPEGADLVYWQADEELLQAAERFRTAGPPEVRGMSEFSWESVGEKVIETLERTH
jgi:glycosyltransferase involved in cell wall biosynthesis